MKLLPELFEAEHIKSYSVGVFLYSGPFGYGKCSKSLNIKTLPNRTADPDQTAPSNLIRVFPDCFSDNHFVSSTSSPDNQHLTERKVLEILKQRSR